MSKPSNKICPRCGKGGYVNYIGQSNIYEAKCYNCGYYFTFGELDLYEEKKPVTNADRIRAMTDKELCAFLCDLTDCPVCPGSEACEDGCGWDKENKVMKGLYAWLRREATP